MSRGPIRVATRGSELARRQAAAVRASLEDHRFDVELVEVETEGDRVRDELVQNLGKTGAFVRALDERVLDGEVDLAVHSMKDVPTEQPDDLVVAAVPERAPAGDVLVTPDGATLEELPGGATVGTSSLRRRAELLAARPDLDVQPLRGNVDTRVEKLLAPGLQAEHEVRLEAEEDGDDAFEEDVDAWFEGLDELRRRALGREVETTYDAVVLARAGLERSGIAGDVPCVDLPREEFVPATGQGALAVVGRDGDVADDVHALLNHPPSRLEATVERTVLATVGGGCIAPVGVHAAVQGSVVTTRVRVLSRDGDEEVSEVRELDAETPVAEARAFAEDLVDEGAADLVQRARRADDATDAPRGDGP
ncbi:MAG: hydroxymethylbilane synthase [Halobacteriaceae archaeon]